MYGWHRRDTNGLAGRGQEWSARVGARLDAPGRTHYGCRMAKSTRGLRKLCGAAALAIVMTASCAVNQTIVIKSDGSGTLAMHVEVSRLLHEYVARLSELSDKPVLMRGGTFFDAASLRKDFESRPGITVTKAATPTPDSLDLELSFDSIQDVFAREETLKSAAALAYSESDGKKTISLHLDRGNYAQLARTFPLLGNPAFAAMGPQQNDTTTDDDYLEMVRFSIGDSAPALLKKSYLTMTLAPEGEILSQSGGDVIGGAVVFRIPLLRLLVLDKPIDCTVTYR